MMKPNGLWKKSSEAAFKTASTLPLTFFDGSINRIAAWAIGTRNTYKALLKAMLEPSDKIKQFEAEGDLTSRLAIMEEMKSYPWTAVWDYFCLQQNVPVREEWLDEVKKYEQEVLLKRGIRRKG